MGAFLYLVDVVLYFRRSERVGVDMKERLIEVAVWLLAGFAGGALGWFAVKGLNGVLFALAAAERSAARECSWAVGI